MKRTDFIKRIGAAFAALITWVKVNEGVSEPIPKDQMIPIVFQCAEANAKAFREGYKETIPEDHPLEIIYKQTIAEYGIFPEVGGIRRGSIYFENGQIVRIT
ncbi:hypothetical protein LCGC14_0758170 [marine sediment metagenome]|uniref:Uncharacterized protein n=1 Tax=marine sediment metagenome TaxID=412755 RepID=A0A0F9Q226_9ZZZZ